MDNFVLLVVPELSSVPAAVCLQHRDQQIFFSEKIGTIIRSSHDSKWQACMRETDADRSWQAGRGKPWTNMRNIFSDEMYKEDPTQDIPDWLQPVTVNLEDLEKCARRFLWKSEHRFGRWRFKSGDTKNGSTVLMLTSANTERDLFHEQKRLVTWQQWSTKSSTKDVNLGTITSSLPWYKVSPFSGYYPCENRTSQETEKNFYGSFQSRRRSQKLSYGRLWRIIMEAISHRLETWNCRTSCTSSTRRDISVLLQSGLNEEWWSDSMKCFYYLQNVQNLLANGKSQIWTKIWGIIQRTNCTIWRTGWISPRTPRKIKQEFINLERKFSQGIVIGFALFPGENLGRRYSNYWGWRIWKFGVIEIFFRKLNAKEVLRTQRDEEFVFPAADGSPKISGRNYKFQEPTLRRESIVRRENISGESQGDREEFQPEESKRWRRNQQGFFGSRRSSERISLIVIILNREVQLHVPRKEHILFDWIFVDITRSTFADLEVAQEKRIYDCWDVDENRNLSTLWTNFTRFTSLSETPLKR